MERGMRLQLLSCALAVSACSDPAAGTWSADLGLLEAGADVPADADRADLGGADGSEHGDAGPGPDDDAVADGDSATPDSAAEDAELGEDAPADGWGGDLEGGDTLDEVPPDAPTDDIATDGADDTPDDTEAEDAVDATDDGAADAADDVPIEVAPDTSEDAAEGTGDDEPDEDASDGGGDDVSDGTGDDVSDGTGDDVSDGTGDDDAAAADGGGDAAWDTGADVDAPETDDPLTDAPADAPPDAGADDAGGADADVPPPRVGLELRPSNTTCLAGEAPNFGVTLTLFRSFSALVFYQPTVMTRTVADPGAWYIGSRNGVIRRFTTSAPSSSTVVLNIATRVGSAASEAGLLGIAFHPNYAATGEVFVSYTRESAGGYTSRVSRFTRLGAGPVVDPESEVIVLEVVQPAANHNGGHVLFGPDGYLYVGLGDGGGANDEFANGQNTETLLGAILRIDIDDRSGGPYGIPADNPFAGGVGGAPEIFAWGFRNPWRFSFDRLTGALWVADVGQDSWEEVNRVVLGGNYGWPIREGRSCFQSDPRCATVATVAPVAVYGRSLGRSVTGGFVYRGASIPDLYGRYVFADYGSGNVFALDYDEDGVGAARVVLATSLNASTLAEAEDGELHLVDIVDGTIHEVRRTGSATTHPIPTLLSETGCFDAGDTTLPGPMLVPFAPVGQLWSDGAATSRWLALPDGGVITVDARGDFQFPVGTVLVKTLALEDRPIETRLLMRHRGGSWGGYSYRWNDDQTDAVLVTESVRVDVGPQEWIFPSPDECAACHAAVAGRSLGLELLQIDNDLVYPSGVVANQVDTLAYVGMLDLTGAPMLTPLVDPLDVSASLRDRAQAYLHTNCAACHQPGGLGRGSMNLHALADGLNACDALPVHGTLGLAGARVIAPRAPERSVLLERMGRRDFVGMPPLASTIYDGEGLALIEDFIRSDFCDDEPAPERCADGTDDDGDGATDCLDDVCASADGCAGSTRSCATPDVVALGTEVSGSTVGGDNVHTGSCVAAAGAEAVFAFVAPASDTYCASTVGSSFDTVVYVRGACNVAGSERACDDDTGGTAAVTAFDAAAGETVWIIVDGYSGDGLFRLTVTPGPC